MGFLIGGTRGLVESEFIPSDGEPGHMAFPIQYETMSSCAITDVESHSVVIAGGLFVEGGISNSDKVARYDEEGFVGDMPSLLVASSEVTDEILEWRDEKEAWGLGVWTELARTYHRASSVTIDENIMKY